ncbi:hypothetical protein ACP70R_003135 [Stipagrostis hirtigluma subsp. patula]
MLSKTPCAVAERSLPSGLAFTGAKPGGLGVMVTHCSSGGVAAAASASPYAVATTMRACCGGGVAAAVGISPLLVGVGVLSTLASAFIAATLAVHVGGWKPPIVFWT